MKSIEELTVEQVELEKNRVMADPKHELHKAYWSGSDPSHKLAIQYVENCHKRIEELRDPVEVTAPVETRSR